MGAEDLNQKDIYCGALGPRLSFGSGSGDAIEAAERDLIWGVGTGLSFGRGSGAVGAAKGR